MKRVLKWIEAETRKTQARIKNLWSPKGVPAAASFYRSKRWQQLRYKAFKKYGKKCQVCKRSDTQLHVDHVKPRSKYPQLAFELSNLQILCRDCNFGKGNWDESDWRE